MKIINNLLNSSYQRIKPKEKNSLYLKLKTLIKELLIDQGQLTLVKILLLHHKMQRRKMENLQTQVTIKRCHMINLTTKANLHQN